MLDYNCIQALNLWGIFSLKRQQYENEINNIVDSRASVWTLEDLRSVQQQDHITAKDHKAIKNKNIGAPPTPPVLLFIAFII